MLQFENPVRVDLSFLHISGQEWSRRRRRNWIAFHVPPNVKKTPDGQFIDPDAWMTQVVLFFENEQLNDSLKPPVTVSSISQNPLPLSNRDIELPRGSTPKSPKVIPIDDPPSGYSEAKIESRVTSPFKPIATPSILNDSTHIEPESSNLPSKRLDFNSFDMDLDQLTEYNTEINRRSSIADFDHATDEENSCDHDSKLKFRKRKPTEKNNDAGNDTPSKKFKIEQEHNVQNDLSLSNDTTNHNNHRNNTNTSNSNTRASPPSTLLEGELSVDIGESNPLILTEEKENEPENVPSKKAKTKKRSKNSFLDRVFKTSLTTNAPNGLRRSRRKRIPTLEYWRNERPLYGRRQSCQFPTYVAYLYRRPDNKFIEKRLFSPSTPEKELSTLK